MKLMRFESFKALREEMRFAFKIAWIASSLVALSSFRHTEGALRWLGVVIWTASAVYCFVNWLRLREPLRVAANDIVSVSYHKAGGE